MRAQDSVGIETRDTIKMNFILKKPWIETEAGRKAKHLGENLERILNMQDTQEYEAQFSIEMIFLRVTATDLSIKIQNVENCSARKQLRMHFDKLKKRMKNFKGKNITSLKMQKL